MDGWIEHYRAKSLIVQWQGTCSLTREIYPQSSCCGAASLPMFQSMWKKKENILNEIWRWSQIHDLNDRIMVPHLQNFRAQGHKCIFLSHGSYNSHLLVPMFWFQSAYLVQELQDISDIFNPDAEVSIGTHDAVEQSSSSSSSNSGLFGWALPVRNPFTRTRSAK